MITAANYLVFVEQFSALTDEQVYARLCYTVSKEPIRYQVVLLLMDGFYQIIDDTVGTAAKMTTSFIKNISLFLALVSAVWENRFEQHLQAERDIVKHLQICQFCLLSIKLRALCVLPASLYVRTTKYW